MNPPRPKHHVAKEEVSRLFPHFVLVALDVLVKVRLGEQDPASAPEICDVSARKLPIDGDDGYPKAARGLPAVEHLRMIFSLITHNFSLVQKKSRRQRTADSERLSRSFLDSVDWDSVI